MLSNVKNFSYYNKKYKFDLVLTSNELPIFEGIFNYCDTKLIKTLDFLHGGTVGFSYYQTILQEYFRDNSNLHFKFIYTEQIKKFQSEKKSIFNINQKYIVTGSNKYSEIFESKFNYLNNNIIKVCYVIGGINGNSIINKGIMNDVSHIVFVFKLIKIFSSFENIKFYIKFGYNVETKIKNFITKYRNYKNINFISSNQRLSNMLNMIDLFILDSIGTPLFELVSTNKPILLYDNNFIKFNNQNFINDLNKRIKIFKNDYDLTKFCEKVNDKPNDVIINLKELFSSTDLFHHYCNGKDIKSTQKAYAKVMELIK